MKPGLFICECGVRKRVAEKHIGRTVPCPECKKPMLVIRDPQTETADSSEPATPADTVPQPTAMVPPALDAPSLEPISAQPPPASVPPALEDEVVLELANQPLTPAIPTPTPQPTPPAPVMAAPAMAPVLAPPPPPAAIPPVEPPAVGMATPDVATTHPSDTPLDVSATHYVKRQGKFLSTAAFIVAALIMVLALVGVTVAFVYVPDKGVVVLPAIGAILASALAAFLAYYWLRLLGSMCIVFADIERNTRGR